jgi:hypothetical protein
MAVSWNRLFAGVRIAPAAPGGIALRRAGDLI